MRNIVEMAALEITKDGGHPVKIHAFAKAIVDAFPIILYASEIETDGTQRDLAKQWLQNYAVIDDKKIGVCVGNVS